MDVQPAFEMSHIDLKDLICASRLAPCPLFPIRREISNFGDCVAD